MTTIEIAQKISPRLKRLSFEDISNLCAAADVDIEDIPGAKSIGKEALATQIGLYFARRPIAYEKFKKALEYFELPLLSDVICISFTNSDIVEAMKNIGATFDWADFENRRQLVRDAVAACMERGLVCDFILALQSIKPDWKLPAVRTG